MCSSSPLQWQSITITLVEKVQIIAVFLGSLFLVASISWLLWSALSPQAVWQRRDVLFQICYGMYGFMDLVCVGEPAEEHDAPHEPSAGGTTGFGVLVVLKGHKGVCVFADT